MTYTKGQRQKIGDICRRGHLLTEHNTRRRNDNTSLRCITCHRLCEKRNRHNIMTKSPIDWTDLDPVLLHLRAEGYSWVDLADRLGVDRKTALRRGKYLKQYTGKLSHGIVTGRQMYRLYELTQQHNQETTNGIREG